MSTTTIDGDVTNDMAVVQIHTGDGDGADIVFECNGKHIAVSMFPSHSSQDCHKSQNERAIEDHLIDLLGQAVDDSDNYDDIVEDISDAIFDAGRPLFAQVVQVPTHSPSNQVLHSLLYPQTFHFRLQTIDSKPAIVPIDPNEAYTDSDPYFDSDLDSALQIEVDFPQYSSMEICVLQTFSTGGAVSRVLVNGREMLCKARRTGLQDPNLEQELDSLQKIARASLGASKSIQVPRLLGYVKHAKNGHIIGLLREWIPSDLHRLRDIDVPTIPKERREKWAAQIRATVNQLHEIGVVWGDGKFNNVVIGNDDNAWLIDFGGGWTEGWVDEELADTIEGDEQAVRNIAKFLGIN